MIKRSGEDPRLTRLTEIALALPETARQIYGSHAQFRVRKKTYAYFLDNHHGDDIVRAEFHQLRKKKPTKRRAAIRTPANGPSGNSAPVPSFAALLA